MTNNKPIVKAEDNTTNELLNRLMAVEVMGLRIATVEDCDLLYVKKGLTFTAKEVDGHIEYKEANYATDMNQAMECLQEFVSGYLYDVQITRTAYNMWRVNIDTVCEPHSLLANITNDSAPLAICKAIAKAKGIDT